MRQHRTPYISYPWLEKEIACVFETEMKPSVLLLTLSPTRIRMWFLRILPEMCAKISIPFSNSTLNWAPVCTVAMTGFNHTLALLIPDTVAKVLAVVIGILISTTTYSKVPGRVSTTMPEISSVPSFCCALHTSPRWRRALTVPAHRVPRDVMTRIY